MKTQQKKQDNASLSHQSKAHRDDCAESHLNMLLNLAFLYQDYRKGKQLKDERPIPPADQRVMIEQLQKQLRATPYNTLPSPQCNRHPSVLPRKALQFVSMLMAVLLLGASVALASSSAVRSQVSGFLLSVDETNQPRHAVTAMGKLLSLLSKPGLTVSQTMDGLTRLDFVCTADESTDPYNQKLRYRWNDRISVLLSFRENETRLKAVTVAVLGEAWTDSQGELRSSNEDMLGYIMDTMDQLSRTGTPNKVPETNASWACSWQFNDMVAAIPTWDDGSPYLDGLLSMDFLYANRK